jgi:PBP1b-binding outer membrane lipoprotein LpoB
LKKNMVQSADSQRIAFLVSALAAAFLFSGCVGAKRAAAPYTPSQSQVGSRQQEQDVAENSITQDRVLPALNRIDKRISSYERRVQSWQEITSSEASSAADSGKENQVSHCQQQAWDVLSGYRQLRNALSASHSSKVSRSLLDRQLPETQSLDINYIEGVCPDMLISLHADTEKTPTQDHGRALSVYAENHQYNELIRAYDSLSLAPGESPGFTATYLYGKALLKTGREYEARRVLNDLYVNTRNLDRKEQTILLRLLGDINFGLGDFATAKKRYSELLRVYGGASAETAWPRTQLTALNYSYDHPEEVHDYASLMRHYLAYNPDRDGFTVVKSAETFENKYPQSQLFAGANEILQQARTDAEKWFANLMIQVDSLSRHQDNQQALALIEEVPSSILPLDKQAILRLKKERLGYGSQPLHPDVNTIQEEILTPADSTVSSGEVQPEKPGSFEPVTGQPVVTDELQRTWKQAMSDLQAKNYDQSIELFSGLLNTSYRQQALERISEASRLAAQDDRKKAAELFVRSNRATDPLARKKLLLASRKLLEGIIEKYPQSGLESKVRRNLQRIDQELAGMDQTF